MSLSEASDATDVVFKPGVGLRYAAAAQDRTATRVVPVVPGLHLPHLLSSFRATFKACSVMFPSRVRSGAILQSR
jgi:hypothetical protein